MPFDLLRLPRELRDLIYFFSLTNYHDANRRYHPLRPPSNSTHSHQLKLIEETDYIRSSLGLLHTNHQVRVEASPYFYDYNRFCFSKASWTFDTLPSRPKEAAANALKLRPLSNRLSSVRLLEVGISHHWDFIRLLDQVGQLNCDDRSPYFQVHHNSYEKVEIELSLPQVIRKYLFSIIYNALWISKEVHFLLDASQDIESVFMDFERELERVVSGPCQHWVDIPGTVTLSKCEGERDPKFVRWVVRNENDRVTEHATHDIEDGSQDTKDRYQDVQN